METVLSGMRPTGKLHIGNYFGAARNFVRMQDDYQCYFFLADYHALTTHTRPEELMASTRGVLAEYLACGLDPSKSAVYVQSHVPQVAELYLFLNMFAYKGELEKCVTFKEKARKAGQTLNAGLLTYPVLMAADILIHRAHKVPVGKDQVQHLEMARNFAERFNHYYGTEVFPLPEAFNFGKNLVKVPGLDGTQKMSKSDSEANAIFLRDPADVVLKKIKRAKTDSGPGAEGKKPPEIVNLFDLMKLVCHAEVIKKFEEDYKAGTIRYGDMKMQLAEDMNAFLEPIREKITMWDEDEKGLKEVAAAGAERAARSANETLSMVKDIIGLNTLLK